MEKTGHNRNERMINLHLFDGAEGSQAAGEAAGDGQPVQPAAKGAQEAGRSGARRSRNNPLANVVYGKQAEESREAGRTPQGAGHESVGGGAPEERQTESGSRDGAMQDGNGETARRAAFDSFVRENRDLYDERVQALMDRRFKGQRELENEMKAARPVLDMLKQKYGAKDVAGLQKAIEADDSYFEDEANERGLTVEQLKEVKRLERENAAFREAERERERQEGMRQAATRWMQQAEKLKAVYPDFDLTQELNDPETGERFTDLLRSGFVDVRTAYELIHKDELMSGAIGYAVRTAQESTLNSIRARGMRPVENGGGGSAAAVIVKKDPGKFTRADREEISRRVARGERIEL